MAIIRIGDIIYDSIRKMKHITIENAKSVLASLRNIYSQEELTLIRGSDESLHICRTVTDASYEEIKDARKQIKFK